jgi:hypothetical protein
MTDHRDPRAIRVPVPNDEDVIGGDQYDYADAFEIEPPGPDARRAEQIVRYALEQAPWPMGLTIRLVHKHVLRFQLAPPGPDVISGWSILESRPDMVHLEATSPVMGRGVMLLRRPDPTRSVFTTYLFFARPKIARVLWAMTGPLHRRFAPILMERANAQAEPGSRRL